MRLPQDRILHIDTEIKDGKMNIVAEWQGELVRCKDCRHGEHIQIPLWENRDIDKAPSQFHDFIKCHKFHIKGFNETLYLGDDDFCSNGERAEQTEYKLPGHDEVMEALDKLTLKPKKGE